MAKLVRIEHVLILVPAVEENLVQVLVHNMLIVTNAIAPMEAVSKSVRKPTRGVVVHAVLDINPVELHVLVCEYLCFVSPSVEQKTFWGSH